MKRIFSVEIAPSIYVLVYGYAAFSKLIDYDTFTVQLSQSNLLTTYAVYLAWLIPAVEIALCILLIIPATRLIALEGSFLLMAMFSVYIYSITRFTDNAPCSCGGVLAKLTWDQHLIFNVVLLVTAGASIFFYPAQVSKRDVFKNISG